MIDLLVAGGGPVGLATAIHAARTGMRVAVAEPRPMPVDKACGEGLMPAAVTELARLGLTDLAGRPFAGIRYTDGHRSADARFAAGRTGLGVRRTVLHRALWSAAEAAGVEIIPVAVDELRMRDRDVLAAGVRAGHLVAADGLHSPIARDLGLTRPTGRPKRWGLRRHYSIAPGTELSDLVEVHLGTDAEAYVTAVDAGQIGIAVLSSVRRPFDEHLRLFPVLHSRLLEATAIAAPTSGNKISTSVLGAGPLRHRTSRRVAGRVLLVGDAAGYIDALTGEGLAVGFSSARRLVEALAADLPESYEQAWRSEYRTYRALTESLLWAGRHRTRRWIVPAAAAVPPAFRTIVRTLGGS